MLENGYYKYTGKLWHIVGAAEMYLYMHYNDVKVLLNGMGRQGDKAGDSNNVCTHNPLSSVIRCYVINMHTCYVKPLLV